MVTVTMPTGSTGASRASVGTASSAVDDVGALGDLTEDRVLAVEPRARVGGHDEELRAVRVRAGVGHRERTAHDLVVVELVVELVAGIAGAVAARAAALDHEVGDDPVEGEAVVEAVGGELREVLDGLRRILVEELDRDVAFAGLHRRDGHAGGPFVGGGCPAASAVQANLVEADGRARGRGRGHPQHHPAVRLGARVERQDQLAVAGLVALRGRAGRCRAVRARRRRPSRPRRAASSRGCPRRRAPCPSTSRRSAA